jgi:hypothetical protein
MPKYAPAQLPDDAAEHLRRMVASGIGALSYFRVERTVSEIMSWLMQLPTVADPDQGDLTMITGDAQGVRPAASSGRSGTNGASPAPGDAGNDLGQLKAAIAAALIADEDVCAYADSDIVDDRLSAVANTAARALLGAGWRPPVTGTDRLTLISVVGGIIDEHFGDDHDEASRVAALAILDAGYLDKTGAVGPPEPVATTLRRIIRDLEAEAVALDGPVSEPYTHQNVDQIIRARTLRKYAERLRQHPALAGAQILCTLCDEPIDHVLSLPGIARVHRLANGAMCPGSLTDKDGA